MTERCEKCARPIYDGRRPITYEQCAEIGSRVCCAVSAAYRRGLRAGVELAKDAAIAVPRRIDEADIDWSDVDAELKRMEEG